MDLIQELAEAFLMGDDQSDDFKYVIDTRNNEVFADMSEQLSGEPGIDWEDEEAENYIILPYADSKDMFSVMVRFAEQQSNEASPLLQAALAGRKPFRSFKDRLINLGLDKDWYAYEDAYAREYMQIWLEEMKEEGTIKDTE